MDSAKHYIRYTTDFLGEKDGYLISAAAFREYQKSGVIDASKKTGRKAGPHFMEHLIPVGQFFRELLAKPTAKNAKKLYAEQRMVITLRAEREKYEGSGSPYGKTFKSSRSEEERIRFINDYGIGEFVE
jgi:hypothetical protein